MADEVRTMDSLRQLANAPTSQKPPVNPDYEFQHLGDILANSLIQSADDLLTQAQQISEQTRLLAAEIRAQVLEQSKILADVNARLKASSEHLLEASRKFNGK